MMVVCPSKCGCEAPFYRRLLLWVENRFSIPISRVSCQSAQKQTPRMAFDAYLQRADDYILKQIHKFEQQKRGNKSPPRAHGYHQMPRYQTQEQGWMSSQGGLPGSPAPPANQYPTPPPPPPPGPMFSEEWAQEYDHQSQRWYYVHKATGRAQWDPPSSGPPHRAATFQPDNTATPHPPFASHRAATFQPDNPNSSGQFLDPRQNGSNPSHSPGLHTQLPPGTHLDMKTGKIVSSMFPEGQTQQSWAQEIQRL